MCSVSVCTIISVGSGVERVEGGAAGVDGVCAAGVDVGVVSTGVEPLSVEFGVGALAVVLTGMEAAKAVGMTG